MNRLPNSRSRFSRRTFLQNSALAALAVPFVTPGVPAFTPFLARIFDLTPLYTAPGGMLRTDGAALAPDSVHNITAAQNEWYATDLGWLPRTALQPIAPYTPPIIESAAAVPFWAELIAPSSTLRAWCDARAPLTARFGYGAVVQVRGILRDDRRNSWYELSSGWANAAHFARLNSELPDRSLAVFSAFRGFDNVLSLNSYSFIQIDRAKRTIELYSGQRLIGQTFFYGGSTLDSDRWTNSEGVLTIDQPGSADGIPWQMRLSGTSADGTADQIALHGAWHHNCFGLPGGGEAIELAPTVAKVLYGLVTAGLCRVVVA